jgi:hypothetical protein
MLGKKRDATSSFRKSQKGQRKLIGQTLKRQD